MDTSNLKLGRRMQSVVGDQSSNSRRDWLAALGLAGIALAVFAPTIGYKFINFDDPTYVTDNPLVCRGLSLEGVVWAFRTFRLANWHPLTWLSFQLDATLWGPDPVGFHLTNVLLHAANAALLFLALRALTGAFWRSIAVALLFAVHPLRIESVAWVAERKDVLSGFFGLLALWAYAGYVRSMSSKSYALVFLAFLFSLLSKSMLVTLPCLFLVLDWWPLRRTEGWRRLVVEKLPLIALVFAISIVTMQAQESRGARKGLDRYPPLARVENATIAYGTYLAKTACPTGLAIFYPHPLYPGGPGLSHGAAATAVVLLLALSVAAIALRRRAPYLLTGWLWYLGTLVPVIGLVQVGGQAYADRYTYFPQIGVLLACCWAAADLLKAHERVAMVAAGTVAAALAAVTLVDLPVWSDSRTLWEHARQTSGDNAMTLVNLGSALEQNGKVAEAEADYRAAIGIDPESVTARRCLGELLYRQGRYREAAEQLEVARDLAPTFALVRTRLGSTYYHLNRLDDAEREHKAAIEADPDYHESYINLAVVEMQKGNPGGAAELYRQAVRRAPGSADAHSGLGVALWRLQQREEGLAELELATRVDAKSAQAWYNLGRALETMGDKQGAANCLERARRLDPRIGFAPQR
jgi:tetratricopeptide (TPR) repeat protein